MELVNKIKENKLIKSSIIYTICGVVLKGISFLTFPIFSRLLTPSDYGIANIFATWTGFVVVFGSLQLNACMPTAKIKFEKEKYNDLVLTILSFVTVIFLTLFIISILMGEVLASWLGLSIELIILMTVQSFFSFITSLYSTVLIQEKSDKKYLAISLISTLLNIILSLLLVACMKENRYVGRILGGVISSGIIGVWLYLKISKGRFLIKKDLLKFALKISLPIVPHILSHEILTNSDRIMLNNFVGSESVGIYGFAYNIGMIIQLVWGSINNAWVPWYFENLKQGNEVKINVAIKNYIIVFTSITVLLILFTPELGKLLAPKEYWEGIKVVPIIAFSYFFVFLYSFPVNMEFYTEKTKYIPIGTVLAAIANIGLNVVFIPKYGMIAATLTTLVSYTLLFIFHVLVVKHCVGYKDKNIKYYIISSIIVMSSIILFYITIDKLIYRYCIIGSIAIYVYIKRFNLIKILGKLD